MTEHVKAFAGYDLGDGESIIDFAILDTKKMKHEFSVDFSSLTMPDNNDPGKAIPTVFGRSKRDGKIVFASEIADDPEGVQDIFMNFKRRPSDIMGSITPERRIKLINILAAGWPSRNDAPELYTDGMQKFTSCVETFTNALFSDDKIKLTISGQAKSSGCQEIVISVGHPTKWDDLDIAVYNAVFRRTAIGSGNFAGMKASITMEAESRAAFLYLKNKNNMKVIQRGESVLIIDTGSSTIDLTAVSADSRNTQYNSGNNYLGARGIDFLIMDWYLGKINEDAEDRKIYEETVSSNPSINQALLFACRSAKEYIYSHASGKKKIECADLPSVRISNDDIRRLAEEKPLAAVLSKYLAVLESPARNTNGNGVVNFIRKVFGQDKGAAPNAEMSRMGNKSWTAVLREFLSQEKAEMSRAGIKVARIIMTGSASKMPFVEEIITEVFKGAEVIPDVDPSRSISMGLALSGPFDEKSKYFRIELEELISKELPEIVKKDLPPLADKISNIIENVVLDIVGTRFRQWKSGNITTMNRMIDRIKGDLSEKELNEKLTGNSAYNSAVKEWLTDSVGRDIAVKLKEICNRYGLSDIKLEDLNFLKFSGGISIGGIKIEPGKEIINAISAVLGVIGGIIAAVVVPFILGVIIGLISLISVEVAAALLLLIQAIPVAGQMILIGVIGIAAYHLITEGVAGAKEAVYSKLMSADLPMIVRNRFSEDTIREKFREKDISGQVKKEILSPANIGNIVSSISMNLSGIIRKRADDIRYVIESK